MPDSKNDSIAGIAYTLRPIGVIRSPLTDRATAPNQGSDGAPDAWLDVDPAVAAGLEGLAPGREIIVITWLHQSRRDVLRLHPQWDERNPLTGVFDTRSPDRPNPLGLHRVRIIERNGNSLKIGPIEAIDGTPAVDIKPALAAADW
jgi:tRNA-Thr(GGU) m(6)t(6)A37 methyltransferase TsaA